MGGYPDMHTEKKQENRPAVINLGNTHPSSDTATEMKSAKNIPIKIKDTIKPTDQTPTKKKA